MSGLVTSCMSIPLVLCSSPSNGTSVMIWDQWNSAHSGPVFDYLARCPNDNCQTFDGSGNVWVKISQLAFNPTASPQWASDFLRERGARWDVVIPPTLAPGSYLLRHEILGLHVAGVRNGAQFYPSCTNIRVIQGGTTQLPTGVALPGAYNPDDTQGVSRISALKPGDSAKLTHQ